MPLPPPAEALPQHTGLGGWLILLAIHQLVRPIRFVVTLVTLSPLIFNLERWRSLTDPGSAAYDPSWKAVLLLEFSGNLILLVWSLLLLVLFFRKRALWPRLYAAFLVFFAAFVAFDFWFAGRVPAVANNIQGDDVRDLTQALVVVAVWVPYCFVSKRVKATFRR